MFLWLLKQNHKSIRNKDEILNISDLTLHLKCPNFHLESESRNSSQTPQLSVKAAAKSQEKSYVNINNI